MRVAFWCVRFCSFVFVIILCALTLGCLVAVRVAIIGCASACQFLVVGCVSLVVKYFFLSRVVAVLALLVVLALCSVAAIGWVWYASDLLGAGVLLLLLFPLSRGFLVPKCCHIVTRNPLLSIPFVALMPVPHAVCHVYAIPCC